MILFRRTPGIPLPDDRAAPMNNDAPQAAGRAPRRFSGPQVFGVVLFAVLATALLAFWAIRTYIYPSEFEPVSLRAAEQQALEAKLRRLGVIDGPGQGGLKPERYTESDANRRIMLSERELNGMIANNTDFASRFVVDLADDLASAKLLVPVDPDFPVLGGKTLRVNAGLELAYANGKPVVVLKGVSVMGVPVPNAWLGNLKNVDLVAQFGSDAGFWKDFADGVEQIKVEDGQLTIQLRE